MRKYEIAVLNYEAALKVSGGLQIGNDGTLNRLYELVIPDDRTQPVSFFEEGTDQLIGKFEIGLHTISLILNKEKDICYTAVIESIDDCQTFPTIPPLRITLIE